MRPVKQMEETIRQMQPLIILGMHRSGTSLTVRLLKDLGVHMGSFLSRDAEAVHFQKINRAIYRSAGSNWGEVDRLIQAMESEKFVAENTQKALNTLFPARQFLNSNRGIADYFGEIVWDQIRRGDTVWWGWKDPRTTLTFPIWLKIFPQGRYLNILRNGIDVAISIHRRSIKQSRKWWKRAFPLDYIPRTLDFDYCFRLWETHLAFLEEKKALIPPGQYMEIRYEDLLADPKSNLRSIAEFMGFPLPEEKLDAVCSQINKGRLVNMAFARPYRENIRVLAESPWMAKFGYSYQFDQSG